MDANKGDDVAAVVVVVAIRYRCHYCSRDDLQSPRVNEKHAPNGLFGRSYVRRYEKKKVVSNLQVREKNGTKIFTLWPVNHRNCRRLFHIKENCYNDLISNRRQLKEGKKKRKKEIVCRGFFRFRSEKRVRCTKKLM